MRILTGRFKGRALPVPPGARPAGSRLRTSLFSVLGASLEGARVLDVCAGAGGLGLEALSRGAAEVLLLERDPRAVAGLVDWLERVTGGAGGRVVRADALRDAWPVGPFDLVFLDPPFAAWDGPGAGVLLTKARAALPVGGRLVAKLPTRHDLAVGPGWRLLDRREAGESAFAILERT